MRNNHQRYVKFMAENPHYLENLIAAGKITKRNDHWLWQGRISAKGAAEIEIEEAGKRLALQATQLVIRTHYPTYRYTARTIARRTESCAVKHCINPDHLYPMR